MSYSIIANGSTYVFDTWANLEAYLNVHNLTDYEIEVGPAGTDEWPIVFLERAPEDEQPQDEYELVS